MVGSGNILLGRKGCSLLGNVGFGVSVLRLPGRISMKKTRGGRLSNYM